MNTVGPGFVMYIAYFGRSTMISTWAIDYPRQRRIFVEGNSPNILSVGHLSRMPIPGHWRCLQRSAMLTMETRNSYIPNERLPYDLQVAIFQQVNSISSTLINASW